MMKMIKVKRASLNLVFTALVLSSKSNKASKSLESKKSVTTQSVFWYKR